MATLPTSQSSKIITWAFGIETAFNIGFGAAAVTFPVQILEQMARSPAFITPTATFLTQMTGGLVLSFAAPLAIGLRAGPREKKMAYWILGAGEVVLIPLLVGKWLNGSDAGLSDNVKLLGMAGNLLPFLLWRAWCLGWRPQWFGKEKGDISL
jgi:hypothetical protein